MSEQASTTAEAGETNEQSTEAEKGFQAITSQEDFDKAIQARIARERAKIPTDYDDLKAAADELAAIKESQKTEAQKVDERLAAAEKRAAELELKAIRATVGAEKGVPVSLLTGSTQEELEASADALIAFRGEAPKPSAAPFIEGTNKVTPETDLGAAIKAAQESRNFALVATLKQQQAAQKG